MSKYFQASKILKGLFLYFAMTASACALVVYGGIKIPGFKIPEPIVTIFGTTNLAIIIAGITLILIVPIIEEIIFRKFLLQWLTGKVGNFRGSMATALLFAAVNTIYRGFVPVFILGLILNWVFMTSKSIRSCILIHVIVSLAAFTLDIMLIKGVIPLDF